MKLDFDINTPLLEQRMRVAAAKKPGRRHHHKPSATVVQRKKESVKRRIKLASVQAKKFKNKVAAYWRGDVDCYPSFKGVK